VLIAARNPRGQVDLPDLLARLAARDVGSILVEGGRGLITAMLQDRLADRLVICIAPKVIGAGVEAIGDLDVRRLDDALTFSRYHFSPLGEDVIFDGQLATSPSR
ncbi:MAG: RibD family protein, partial [Chloroflexota bacterium]